MWYSPTPICLFNPITAGFGNKGCSACEGLLSVDPKGNILPCSSWSEPIGNLLEEGFETVWFNKRSEYIRDKRAAPSECRECRDFAVVRVHARCILTPMAVKNWYPFGIQRGCRMKDNLSLSFQAKRRILKPA